MESSITGEGTTAMVPVYAATGQGLQRRGASGPAVVNVDGGIQALFDGVLYNRQELATRLGVDRASDPAIVLALAYRRWGDGFLNTARGTFALILFDVTHRRLIAARDPLGVYPLFYSQIADRVLFSTAVGALVAQPEADRRPNTAALAEMLIGRWTSPYETPYAAIRRVCPGHCRAWAADGTQREWRYWRPLPAAGPFRHTRPADLDQFGHLFSQAVDRCLEGERAGIWMSGGLDSCSVAMQAADLAVATGSPTPVGLALDFPDPAINERRVQEAVARCFNLPLVLMPFAEAAGPAGLLAEQLALSRAWDVPIWNI
jgi:asparagine synthase (glutamine-hydrolysing)